MIPALIWTSLALIGLMLSVYMLYQAGADAYAIRHIANGRRLLARGHVRRELFRVILQVAWVIVGVAALLSVGGALVLVILLATPGIVALNTALDIRQRRQEESVFGPNR